MKQKHDARAYFGKKVIVFDFLRNLARNRYEIGYEIRYEKKNILFVKSLQRIEKVLFFQIANFDRSFVQFIHIFFKKYCIF